MYIHLRASRGARMHNRSNRRNAESACSGGPRPAGVGFFHGLVDMPNGTSGPLPIPGSDWQTDLYWSQVFGIQSETFREKKIPELRELGVETLRWGNRTLIKSTDLISAIEKQNAAR